jgi:hypothetical protein
LLQERRQTSPEQNTHISPRSKLRRFREQVITPQSTGGWRGEHPQPRPSFAAFGGIFAPTSIAMALWYVVPGEYK